MKFWFIALKDVLIQFRDRNAVLLMLAAPLVMAFIMGAAFGGQGNQSTSPIQDIPVIIVNQDEGELGQIFADVFAPDNLDGLFAPVEMDDLAGAMLLVQKGEVRAVVYVPPTFSQVIRQGEDAEASVQVEVYTDPVANISPFIVRSVVDQITGALNVAIITQEVATSQILEHARELGPKMTDLEEIMRDEMSGAFQSSQPARKLISLSKNQAGEAEQFNLMGYFAPSMAIFFLMFTMFDGTRTILEERQGQTLQRIITTATPARQFIAGKILGSLLTGLLQFTILVLATSLIFQLNWGDPVGVVLLVISTVLAATSIGVFVASLTKNLQQANIAGTVITLVFAVLGGNFVSLYAFSGFINTLSKLTINRWALEGFTELSLAKVSYTAILPNVGVLLGISLVFFTISVNIFYRRFVK